MVSEPQENCPSTSSKLTSYSQATILRQIVAGPRSRHPEAGLDLCYLTDNIIVTSGPSSIWPRKAYRNPLDQLVKFLDEKHQADWSIFEFRAEGTGYPDSEVYNRIHHFPWPDHHPPPFAIVPGMMASMRRWIQGDAPEGGVSAKNGCLGNKRVAVVHCKAGKGRSGTASCAYLISEEGWSRVDALQRFTARRMRAGFGDGVSIPSQLRWVRYVERWATEMNKQYVERPVELVELHVSCLRDGVKVAVQGYVDDGRRIQVFHTFQKDEAIVMDNGQSLPSENPNSSIAPSCVSEPSVLMNGTASETNPTPTTPSSNPYILPVGSTSSTPSGGATVILKPTTPIILPTSDVNVNFVRHNKAAYTNWTMVSSVAHVWMNAYFEGGHEGHDSGVFEADWEGMDGIRGGPRKGTRAFDHLKVVWRYASEREASTVARPSKQVITQPSEGEEILEPGPADGKGGGDGDAGNAGVNPEDAISTSLAIQGRDGTSTT